MIIMEEGLMDTGVKDQVFTISQSAINKVKIKRKYSKSSNKPFGKNFDKFSDKQGKPKFKVNPEALKRHSRGDGVIPGKVKTKYGQKLVRRKEEIYQSVQETAARAEILLQEQSGFIETEENDAEEFTSRISQTQLRRAVDEESAAKGFELNLGQFGPYKIDYTRNGRFLLLGGRKGHVAALDWQEKKLRCEINVQESVHDVKWLHTENMFAVAQKKWTYIYDNQGIELHCLKNLDSVLKMEFLPYHFLLATASEASFLSWLDISIGKMVAQYPTRMGRLSIMCMNPYNAVLCCGHSKGIVTMWTPNKKEPVAKMLVHRQPLTSIAVDRSGTYMATTAMDRSLKIWDVRNTYKELASYSLPGASGASHIEFSDRRLLGISIDNEVQIYKDVCTKPLEFPYLTHKVWKPITDIHFVPYEDVMGIGHAAGFSSILVPGSGEPNFDSLEANPYQTKKQRQEAEVKALLDKIQPELISLNPNDVGEVNMFSLQERLAGKASKTFVKPPKIDFEPRNRTRGKSGTAKTFHIKRTVKEEAKLRNLKDQLAETTTVPNRDGQTKKERKPKDLLQRL